MSGETATATRSVRLSVVIPTRNRSAMTLRAVESVLTQQNADQLELIVVIDGSTDDTETALRSRYGGDLRMRIRVTPQRHASAARNAGFAMSRGELVCFLDSDDYWTDGAFAVAEQVFACYPELAFVSLDGSTLPRQGAMPIPRVMRTTGPGWSNAGFVMAPLVHEQMRLGNAQGEVAMLRGDFFPAIAHGDLFSLNGLYMRREAAIRAGPFNERFRWYNDWEFFARLCLQGPGAYLDYEGFRRDVGRPDEISHGRPLTGMPRRHLYILHTLPRRFPECDARYGECLQSAMVDALYQMGGALARSRHRRWAWRYLRRCLLRRYKIGKSLVHLARSWLPPSG